MMLLYEHPLSSYAQKVKIALREKGLDFQAVTPPALVAAPAAVDAIRAEIKRGALVVSVSWPVVAAGECAAWLRELLR